MKNMKFTRVNGQTLTAQGKRTYIHSLPAIVEQGDARVTTTEWVRFQNYWIGMEDPDNMSFVHLAPASLDDSDSALEDSQTESPPAPLTATHKQVILQDLGMVDNTMYHVLHYAVSGQLLSPDMVLAEKHKMYQTHTQLLSEKSSDCV
jgi:hypothetical protein